MHATQASSPDYFALLGVPAGLDVDGEALKRHYLALQQLLHPDQMAGKSAAERQAALQRSMDVNEAYRTLGSDLLRAQYLLKCHGIDVLSEQASYQDMEVLHEAMQLREAVAQLQARSDSEDAESAQAEHGRLRREIEEKTHQIMQGLHAAFAEEDYAQAARWAVRLQYVTKLSETL